MSDIFSLMVPLELAEEVARVERMLHESPPLEQPTETPRARLKVIRIERDADGNLVPVYNKTLRFCELRLDYDDCSIMMTLHDDDGNVVTLEYGLLAKTPETFDLDLLREAWDNWRAGSAWR